MAFATAIDLAELAELGELTEISLEEAESLPLLEGNAVDASVNARQDFQQAILHADLLDHEWVSGLRETGRTFAQAHRPTAKQAIKGAAAIAAITGFSESAKAVANRFGPKTRKKATSTFRGKVYVPDMDTPHHIGVETPKASTQKKIFEQMCTLTVFKFCHFLIWLLWRC